MSNEKVTNEIIDDLLAFIVDDWDGGYDIAFRDALLFVSDYARSRGITVDEEKVANDFKERY